MIEVPVGGLFWRKMKMNIESIRNITVVTGDDAIANADALLKLAMHARYETGADRFAIE